MSQNSAEKSDLVAGVTKLKIYEEDRAMKNNPQKGLEVNGCGAEKVKGGSEILEIVAEIEADNDKVEEEPEGYIQFLFDPEVPETVLNEYVINEIAKFLKFGDLKSVRRMNKLWSVGATLQFVRKSAIVLKSGERSQEELEAFENDTKALKGVTALKIELRKEFEFEQESELFNDILSNLSPSLKSLQLVARANNPIFLPRATIQLPALTSFTFDSCFFDFLLPYNETKPQFFKFLYPSAPNLTELVVSRFEPAVFSPLLSDDGSATRNWSLAQKLKSLKVRYHIFSEEYLSTIIKFPQSWKSLDIRVVMEDSRRVDTCQLLAQLLENNSDSLVRLMLGIDIQLTRPSPEIFRFSNTFSKLQKLQLVFWKEEDDLLNFGEGVNYSATFPRLTSFVFIYAIDPDLVALAQIWAFLFPPQVFRGLQYLEINLDDNYTEFLRVAGIEEDWAEIIFPNARLQIY